jgi:two-component system invasion response regulator UvrY
VSSFGSRTGKLFNSIEILDYSFLNLKSSIYNGFGMIKVLLADDHSIVRAGLRRIVEESGEMEVIAEAADGREAIDLVHKALPDVAVIDISMPGLDGLEVLSQLRNHYPKLPILILTMHEEGQYVVRAIEAGAMGYLTKQSAPEQLVKAIRKVHSGSRYVTDEAAEALALRIARGAQGKSALDSLSMRELQVLRRLALGHTNREIASAYHISIKTVDTYRSRLLKKLNLRNNAELSRFAIQNRLIES